MSLLLTGDRIVAMSDIEAFDAASQQAIERLVAMAAELFGSSAALALLDAGRVRLAACVGFEPDSLAVSETFQGLVARCGPNATFSGTEESAVRFYAGAALTGDDGRTFGALVVLDRRPRELPSRSALQRLRLLARLVVDRLDAAALKRRAQRHAQLMSFIENTAKIGHWVWDVEQGLITLSHEARRVRGVDPVGAPISLEAALAPYPPDQRILIAAELERVARDGGGFELMLQLTRPDGAVRDILCRGQARRRPGQAPGRSVYGVIQDVTEHQDRLRGVERNRARYQLLADHMADVVARIRLDGACDYISPGIERLLGYAPPDMRGQPAQAFVCEEDRPALMAALKAMAGGEAEQTVQLRARHRDGRPVWVEARLRLHRDALGLPMDVIAVIRDIQDRMAAEAALAESEARHRLIAESARDVITRSSAGGELLYVSPSVECVAGYTPADLVGRRITALVHPGDRAGFKAAYHQLSTGDRPCGQSLRYRVRRKDGGWVWIESNPTVVRDTDGQPTGYVDVARAIGEQMRLEADLRAARDEAKAAVEAKTEFLSNMSHELRTPLTAVIGFAGLLAANPELGGRSRHMVERIEGAGKRLMSVINDILDFSKLEAGAVVVAREPTDLRALVCETAQLLEERAAAKGLTLAVDVAPDAPASFNLDPGRVRQVLLNLAGNAVKFTGAGQVAIRVEPADGGVIIKVVDSGAGLTSEQIGRLFQRFSQLDGSNSRAHGGTGLGLAISKALVEAMGGRIGVWSSPGRGSTFWFQLPEAPARAAEGVAA